MRDVVCECLLAGHGMLAAFLGILAAGMVLPAAEEAAVVLRETLVAGACTQVRIELKADGLFKPGLPPGSVAPEAKLPKPLALDIQSRLAFSERLLAVPRRGGEPGEQGGDAATGRKAIRYVRQAASAINGDVRPTAGVLRPGLSLLVAERAAGADTVTVVSPAGPMTRAELELVQGLADPLVLADLLPRKPVSRGDSWKLPDSAVFALTDYDELTSAKLVATLDQLDESTARIKIQGEVEGSARGGVGRITCEGVAGFDRRTGLVDHLELNRAEKREPGPVEAGLDVKSTLTVVRRPALAAPELAEAALAGLPLDTSAPRQLLQMISPDGRYNVLHDRRWHTFWDDPKHVVLKRLDKGRVLAHCNLSAGPSVGKGKHQDLSQFRDDLKRSLGERFVQFLGAGEVDGDPEGGFRYKVGVQGREGDLGVLWNYYLVASPEGDQLLVTFTLAEKDAAVLADQDLEIIGSLQWTKPPPPEKAP